MKLQKNTLVLVLCALGLGAYAIATTTRLPADPPRPTAETPAAALFSLSEAELAAIAIEREAETLRLTKSAPETNSAEAAADAPTWAMASPQEGPVTAAAIAFLVDLLLSEPETTPHSFQVEPDLLGEYGLADPPLTLVLELQDGSQQRLLLGNPSFDGQSLYARLEPETDGAGDRATVFLLDAELQAALERPVTAWLQAADEASEDTAAPTE